MFESDSDGVATPCLSRGSSTGDSKSIPISAAALMMLRDGGCACISRLTCPESFEGKSTPTSSLRDVREVSVNVAKLSRVYADRIIDLKADDVSMDLAPEEEDGAIEYKLKLVDPSPERTQHLVTQMNYRLTEGHGECLYQIGFEDKGTAKGIEDVELESSIRTICRMAAELHCEVFVSYIKKGRSGKVAQLLVRRKVAEGEVLDVRICALGDVESGKSTLLGVLLSGKLDNGKGSSRMHTFKHRHEAEKGLTSSMSRHIIGFTKDGQIVNQEEMFIQSWSDVVKASAKLIMFVDLAGHKKYLKTTLFGLSSQVPDYVMVAIDAVQGLTIATSEHLYVLFALRVPVFIVITKLDLASTETLQALIDQLVSFLSSEDVSKQMFVVKLKRDLTNFTDRMLYEEQVPVFLISSVTGEGLPELRYFLQVLHKPYDWNSHSTEPVQFIIDETHEIGSTGTVVTGILHRGSITIGHNLLLGPFPRGDFRPVLVKSIHVHRTPVRRACSGQAVSLALKNVKRTQIRKGMALVDPALSPIATIVFEVEACLLKGSGDVQPQSEPILHIGTINQAASVVSISPGPILKAGQSATIVFKFCHQAEYIRIEDKVIFRQENARGVGTVVRLITTAEV